MRQSKPFHNLYPTSILICCIPIKRKVVCVYLIPGATHSQRLSFVVYTTGTATEFDPSGIRTQSYPAPLSWYHMCDLVTTKLTRLPRCLPLHLDELTMQTFVFQSVPPSISVKMVCACMTTGSVMVWMTAGTSLMRKTVPPSREKVYVSATAFSSVLSHLS